MRRWSLVLLCLGVAAGADELAVPVGGAETYKLTATLAAAEGWPAEAVAEVRFDLGEARCYALVFDATQVRLVRREPTGQQVIGTTRGRNPISEAPLRLTVCRERWRKRLIVNGEVWLTAFDDVLPPGEAVLETKHRALAWAEPAVQSTEAIYFSDDFMRNPGDGDGWAARSGTWDLSGVSAEDANEKGRPQANLSSNPFALRATKADSGALTETGFWFWDTYRADVSMRAEGGEDGDGEVGLVAYLQDPNNYLAFRWKQAGAGAERQLVAVVDGREEILAAAEGGWAGDQWYRLGLTVIDDHLEARIDDEPVLSATCGRFGQGKVALWSSGVTFADFDDVSVVGTEALVDTFGQLANGRWDDLCGSWTTDPRAQAPLNAGVRKVQGNDYSVAVTGEVAWRDYRLTAQVKIPRGGGVGLVACYLDPQHFLAFRLGDQRAPGGFQNRVVKVAGEQEQPIVGDTRWITPNQWHSIALESRSGFVRAYVDGTAVWEVFDAELTAGKAGLIAAGDGVQFDQVEVAFLEPDQAVTFPEQFTEEQSMHAWAAAEGSWYVAQGEQRGGVIWHRGDFYGDPYIALDPAVFRGASRGVKLILDGDGATPQSGHTLYLIKESAESTTLKAQLQIAGQPVREGVAPLADVGAIRFIRRGWFLMGYADEACFVTHLTTPQTLQRGIATGVAASGPPLDLSRVTAGSDHLYDTTFVTAPWQFHIEKGIWETINRWKCDPRWSFFGGYNDRQPLIWSKDDYAGDIRLEAYMAIRMDNAGGMHYLHPSDLSLAVCGDGKDPRSGYTFLFAGRRNTASMLFRDGQMIGQNTGPAATFRFTGPGGGGLEAFHRHWFHVVLSKRAGRVQCSVDDELIFDVADPQPLPGGKIALYCVNNGIMVARAKVWYQQKAPRVPLPDVAARLALAERPNGENPWENGFEGGLGTFRLDDPRAKVLLERVDGGAASRRSLRITNLTVGGTLAVRAVDERFQLADRPVLRFQAKIPAQVRVNCYLRARGLWYVIPLTGSDAIEEPQRLLARAPMVEGDNAWHKVEVNLRDAFGGDSTVERIVFGMLEPDEYAHAGFYGNPFGSSWQLDDFYLGP